MRIVNRLSNIDAVKPFYLFPRMLKMAVQQGRSDAKERGLPLRYVERLCDARRQLTDIFSILLNFKLRLIQTGIHPATSHEGVVIAFFDNRALLHHQDAVHIV